MERFDDRKKYCERDIRFILSIIRDDIINNITNKDFDLIQYFNEVMGKYE